MLDNSKADIKTISESSTHIDIQERNELYTLLNKYEFSFDNNLGTWHVKPYDIKLKPDAEPLWKTFIAPRIHELTFREELNLLEYLKFIKKVPLPFGRTYISYTKGIQHSKFYL